MDKNNFLACLHERRFVDLFNGCGWDSPSSKEPITILVGERSFVVHEVAQKKLRIFSCEVDSLPPPSIRRTLDAKLRKFCHAYFIIFILKNEDFHQQWMVPVDAVDKRRLIITEYQDDTHAEPLYAKVCGISFDIQESPSVHDVIARVNEQFVVNASDVTKKFYTGFRKQHDAFVDGLEGITDSLDRDWYASVMLNRLMFCYFIQKKGFFMDKFGNPDLDYLQNHLNLTSAKKGPDKFYGTFYKGFLRGLFEHGLNMSAERRPKSFKDKYGLIPYLNGGMFEAHLLEKRYPEIDVPDAVFSKLFAFFDEWRWHLDDRIERDGRDINPDVLGYIFEQYINDRAKMGAYYTKEDITEYIGRNCILPFLFLKVLGKSSASSAQWVWDYLRDSGDRYIFSAVKKGVELQLPPEIQRGVDTTKPDLRKRRADWNKPAAPEYALPTEIWRETVARRQRYAETVKKIKAGKITDIHEFITYNLDIRAFAEDLIRNTDDPLLVKHFYDALRDITILDPTCGSGAFLFAGLNILEPLYEACLDRMEEFHAKDARRFKDELAEIKDKYRSNRQYFIYKNIILRNLYGVDIMHEATEIARLRLFLKMVAVVEADPTQENLGLDPLPDVDFNIRCGNTLVGYASHDHLVKSLKEGGMGLFADEEIEKVSRKAADVADSCGAFRRGQLSGDSAFYYHKTDLNKMITELGDQLDKTLAKMDYNIDSAISKGKKDFLEWKTRAQPFHWYSEFYNIIAERGGFDVIIGNPPYVEYSKVKEYKLVGYDTIECGNLYAYVVERSLQISSNAAKFGMIIPSASVCTPRMEKMQTAILNKASKTWISLWDERPSKLFDGVDQQLSIQLASKGSTEAKGLYITAMKHWESASRCFIFSNLQYGFVGVESKRAGVFPKGALSIETSVAEKIRNKSEPFATLTSEDGSGRVFYRNAGGRYWRLVKSFPSYFSSAAGAKSSSTEKVMTARKEMVKAITALLSSTLFYWFWRLFSNCRHLTDRELLVFPIPTIATSNALYAKLGHLGERFEERLKATKKRVVTNNKRSGKVIQDFYYVSSAKPIIDEIDELLAKHFGFTEEELDFIINYDIKYRMGDELDAE